MISSDSSANGCSSGRSRSSNSSEFEERASTDKARNGDAPPPNPLAPLLAHFAEWREYAGLYCAARMDQWRISAESSLYQVAYYAIGAVVGGTALIVATVFIFAGLAAAVGGICGDRIWVGQILVGSAVLLSAFIGLAVMIRQRQVAETRRMIAKYESRKQRERGAFGTDVAHRAAGATRK